MMALGSPAQAGPTALDNGKPTRTALIVSATFSRWLS
jgi:hypothetical protein